MSSNPIASTGPVHRAAVYFSPLPDSPWSGAGNAWLGRSGAHPEATCPPMVAGIDAAAFAALTAAPRRYGWHATLKPPFRLRTGLHIGDLETAVGAIAQTYQPIAVPALEVSTLGSFLALRPQGDLRDINALAAACVTRLQPLAEPLNEGELARRREPPLTADQDALLQAWGYPWVLDAFRFHLSLTGLLTPIDERARQALLQAARAHFEGLPPLHIESLAVFVEPSAGADFVLHRHFSLGAQNAKVRAI
jgi:putative phosphonate metabolism protein